MDSAALHAEVVELTQELIRVDTTNGNETSAARLLEERLSDVGIDTTIVSPDDARGNLVARIAGSGEGPTLALVGHLDVVPADPRDWSHPPFEGVIDDRGFLFGRGAVDMKNEVAIRTVTMLELAREGFRPQGDLLLVMVADEEDGTSGAGMSWLTREHPEIAADFSLNEGGGMRHHLADGRVVSEISVGEKGTYPVRVDALGEAGHASTPSVGRNAVPLLAELLRRIDIGLAVPQRSEALDDILSVLLGPEYDGDVEGGLAAARALSPMFEHSLPAMCGTTMAPTRLYASTARNVLPARAGVDLDCRVLPGTTPDEVESAVRQLLGEGVPYELSFPEEMISGSSSPASGRLWDACRSWLATDDPEAELLPTLCTGFTDSVYLREAFGTVAYGYSPQRSTPPEVAEAGYHNADERVHVDDLLLGVQFHLDVARRLLG